MCRDHVASGFMSRAQGERCALVRPGSRRRSRSIFRCIHTSSQAYFAVSEKDLAGTRSALLGPNSSSRRSCATTNVLFRRYSCPLRAETGTVPLFGIFLRERLEVATFQHLRAQNFSNFVSTWVCLPHFRALPASPFRKTQHRASIAGGIDADRRRARARGEGTQRSCERTGPAPSPRGRGKPPAPNGNRGKGRTPPAPRPRDTDTAPPPHKSRVGLATSPSPPRHRTPARYARFPSHTPPRRTKPPRHARLRLRGHAVRPRQAPPLADLPLRGARAHPRRSLRPPRLRHVRAHVRRRHAAPAVPGPGGRDATGEGRPARCRPPPAPRHRPAATGISDF